MANIKGLKFETMSKSYTVVTQIGEGGAGTVFKVIDEDGLEFALKQLSPKVVSTEKVKRFKNEMGFLAKSYHRNLVTVFDTGFTIEKDKKIPFYLMPLYGQTLRTLITNRIKTEKVLHFFGHILNGVEALHLKGIWHRDLKPENILYDEQKDELLIADLGIAHFEEDELHTNIITKVGTKLANFEYAPPEQRRKGGVVDARADIYALGLILNEMVTGSVIQGLGYKTIESVASEFAYLDEMVSSMAQQLPENRPNSIDNIKQQLIGRRNDFIQRQKISELEKTVIPASTLNDPLVNNPVKGVGVDFENGLLIFTLNQSVTDDWAGVFKSQNYSTALMGATPSDFQVRTNQASVRARENDIPRIAEDFKSFLNRANEKYKYKKERELIEKEQREKEALHEETERQRKAAELRSSVLSKIRFD